MKNRKIKTIISIAIVMICLWGIARNAWSDSDALLATSDSSDTKTYEELQNETQYQIKFLNIAKGIEYISFRFQLPDYTGNLSIRIAEQKEDTVLWDGTFDLSLYSQQEIEIPLFSSNLYEEMKFGKGYTIDIRVSNREGLAPVKIRTTDHSAFFAEFSASATEAVPLLAIYANQYLRWSIILLELMRSLLLLFLIWLPVIKVTREWIRELIPILLSVVGYIIIEIETTNLPIISFHYALSNILFLYIFIKLLQVVFIDIRIAGYITLPLCALIGALDYYVNLFRGSPVVPWDIYGLATVTSVVGQYNFVITRNLCISFYITISSIAILSKLDTVPIAEGKLTQTIRNRLHVRSKRVMPAAKNFIIFLCGLLIARTIAYPSLQSGGFNISEMYQTQGFVASFIAYAPNLRLEKPGNYSIEKAEAILAKYDSDAALSPIKAKNIIFIMNESFADLRMINDALVPDDYMPYWDSLQENTIKGKLYVPVFGGGTCDPEFEALTGLSTKYTGVNPYVSKIHSNVDSLAQELSEQGFQTIGFHPYKIKNWNRNNAYPRLGFQEVYDMNDMTERELVRWTISDEASYREIIRYFENKTSDSLFVFDVTVQNHAAYNEEWETFQNTVDLSHLGDFPQVEQYLSLIKVSDQALEELITYFSDIDEPTLICVFGDHQAALEEGYYEYLFGKPIKSLSNEEKLERYTTPFLIWANYDLPEMDEETLSANYLRTRIMQYSGQELSAFDSFLNYLSTEYPVVTRHGIVDKNGTFHLDLESDLLKEYQILCYYMITGNHFEQSMI